MKKGIAVFLAAAMALPAGSCKSSAPSEGALDLEPRIYTYSESDELIPPSIQLLEGDRFQFTFSALSSYIAFGSCRADGDTLVLNTDDGDFRYTFKITEDGLVFDAANSSENIWYADFTDGALFQ